MVAEVKSYLLNATAPSNGQENHTDRVAHQNNPANDIQGPVDAAWLQIREIRTEKEHWGFRTNLTK
jgi:hypothetical protein